MNVKQLKRELRRMGIKTYRSQKTQASYVKKADIKKVLAGDVIDIKTGKQREHGFDLTDISADDWGKLKKLVGLGSGKLTEEAWVWSGDGITVFTANNPETGEYYRGGRDDEKDYASYIGIEGDPQQVGQVVEFIKKHGDSKDESPGRREFI